MQNSLHQPFPNNTCVSSVLSANSPEVHGRPFATSFVLFFVFSDVMRIQVSEVGGPTSARPLPGDPQGYLRIINLCDAGVLAEVWVSKKYSIKM